MNTKLTLKLDHRVIKKAKEYARLHNTSLSSMIESYLQKIIDGNVEGETITPLVKSLSGIINLPKDFDQKNSYSKFIGNKYK
jgi:hypothetical protein